MGRIRFDSNCKITNNHENRYSNQYNAVQHNTKQESSAFRNSVKQKTQNVHQPLKENKVELCAAQIFWEKYACSWTTPAAQRKNLAHSLITNLENELCRQYTKIAGAGSLLIDNQGLILKHVDLLLTCGRVKNAQKILDLFLNHQTFNKSGQLATVCARVTTASMKSLWDGLYKFYHFSKLNIPFDEADPSAMAEFAQLLSAHCKYEPLGDATFKHLKLFLETRSLAQASKDSLLDAVDAYIWKKRVTYCSLPPSKQQRKENVFLRNLFVEHAWKDGSEKARIANFDFNQSRFIKDKHWTALGELCWPTKGFDPQKTKPALQSYFQAAFADPKGRLYHQAARLIHNPQIRNIAGELIHEHCSNQTEILFVQSFLKFIYDCRGDQEYEGFASFLLSFQPDEKNADAWKVSKDDLWQDLLDHATENQSWTLLRIQRFISSDGKNNTNEIFEEYFTIYKRSKAADTYCQMVIGELQDTLNGEMELENEDVYNRLRFMVGFESLDEEGKVLQIITNPKLLNFVEESKILENKCHYYKNQLIDNHNRFMDLSPQERLWQRAAYHVKTKMIFEDALPNLPSLKNAPEDLYNNLIKIALECLPNVMFAATLKEYQTWESQLFNLLPANHYKLNAFNADEINDFSIFLAYEDSLYKSIATNPKNAVLRAYEIWKIAAKHAPNHPDIRPRLHQRGCDAIAAMNYTGSGSEAFSTKPFFDMFEELGWFTGDKDMLYLLSMGKVRPTVKKEGVLSVYQAAFDYATSKGCVKKSYLLFDSMAKMPAFSGSSEMVPNMLKLLEANILEPTARQYDNNAFLISDSNHFLDIVKTHKKDEQRQILDAILKVYQAAWLMSPAKESLLFSAQIIEKIQYGLLAGLYTEGLFIDHLKLCLDPFADIFIRSNRKENPILNLITAAKQQSLAIDNRAYGELLKLWMPKISK